MYFERRERASTHTGTRVGEGQRERIPSRLKAQCRVRTHGLRDHDLSRNQRVGRLTDWVTQGPRAPVFLRGEHLCSYGAPVIVADHPLSHVTLLPKSLQASTPGTLHGQRIETHQPSFCERGLFASLGVSSLAHGLKAAGLLFFFFLFNSYLTFYFYVSSEPNVGLELLIVRSGGTCSTN